MAWAVEKHCLEIKCNNNAIYEFLTLQWNLDEVEKLYRGYLSVVCTFFGTMKLTDRTTQLKSYENQIIVGRLWPALFYDQH